jgi:hypothetical protein
MWFLHPITADHVLFDHAMYAFRTETGVSTDRDHPQRHGIPSISC